MDARPGNFKIGTIETGDNGNVVPSENVTNVKRNSVTRSATARSLINRTRKHQAIFVAM